MSPGRRGAITKVSGAIAFALIALGALRCLDPHNPLRVGGSAAPGALPHLVNIGGILHASGYCTPIPTCTTCHGDSLQGGLDGEPSCTTCHIAHWDSPSCGTATHTIDLGGHLHALHYCTPLEYCARCHGPQLQGGLNSEPSCTKCHVDHWNSPNCGTAAHTVNFDGHLHAPNYCSPLQYCARCHGSQLRGGSNGEPSCTACHDQKWTEPGCGGER